MTNERKKEVRFSLIPTIKIVDEEVKSFHMLIIV